MDEGDRNDFYHTCYSVLTTFCKLAAPLIPFVTEEMYRNLTGAESVHLEEWPSLSEEDIHQEMESSMQSVRELAGIVHMMRKMNNVPVRTPIKRFEYQGPTEISFEYVALLQDETNVEQFVFTGNSSQFEAVASNSTFAPENLNIEKGEARKLVRDIQMQRKELKTKLNQFVDVTAPEWPAQYEEFIKNEALVRTISKGDFSVTPV
jgi:valyl-tRNA synthetase